MIKAGQEVRLSPEFYSVFALSRRRIVMCKETTVLIALAPACEHDFLVEETLGCLEELWQNNQLKVYRRY